MLMKKLSEDHYIICDDSEIKEDDFFLMNSSIIRQCDYIDGYMLIDTTQGKHHISVCNKITNSTQPLAFLNVDGFTTANLKPDWSNVKFLPLSEVKELLGVVDVENRANDILKGFVITKDERKYFEFGYNECLKDKKEQKYTEEDMLNAHYIGWIDRGESSNIQYPKARDLFKQSLQPTEWELEFVDGKLKLKS